MSVRHGLLALLQCESMYGYQLRAAFEASTGGTWPLNVGQVYTTLARLERDGSVTVTDGTGGTDPDTQKTYTISDAGRAELDTWFAEPVSRARRPRDELAIKLAMAIVVPGIDVRAVVQAQRTDTIRALQDYTRLKARAEDGELSWLLVVDSLIFTAEAEVRWLDHCETRLARHRPASVGTPDPARLGTPSPAPAGPTRGTSRTEPVR